jgi:hypothetical protein
VIGSQISRFFLNFNTFPSLRNFEGSNQEIPDGAISPAPVKFLLRTGTTSINSNRCMVRRDRARVQDVQRLMKFTLALTTNLVVLVFACAVFAAEPLPSWNDRAAKQGIVAFVKGVTEQGSKDFVRRQGQKGIPRRAAAATEVR